MISLALMGGWIRSYFVCDQIFFRDERGYVRSLASASGWLRLIASSYEGDNPAPPEWGCQSIELASFVGAAGCSDDELALPYGLFIPVLLSASLVLRRPKETPAE